MAVITEELLVVLKAAIANKASDVLLKNAEPVFFRQRGDLIATDYQIAVDKSLAGLLTDAQRKMLEKERSLDFAFECLDWRWRGNAYYTGGELALVCRLLPKTIPKLAELGLPPVLKSLTISQSGLILLTGCTGAGKTTTLAAFLQTIAAERSCHIVTLEDPVEYILKSENTFISQREYKRDFTEFPQGLRDALRENADVIMVGEIRDPVTMRVALEAAATGVLVIATLHAGSALLAARRIEAMFYGAERDYILQILADVLLGIFAQRLLPKAGGGRIAAVEILLATTAVKNTLRQGDYQQLASIMLSGKGVGMKLMADRLQELYEQHLITQETWQGEMSKMSDFNGNI